MRRWLLLGSAVIAIAAFALWWDNGGQGWLAIHTGTRNEPGVYYAYWSGFGSVIPWSLLALGGVVGVLIAFLRKVNCHERGCPLIGRFPIAGGNFHYCGKHHPDWKGKHPTREWILHRHEEHKGEGRLLNEIHKHVTALAPKAGDFPPSGGSSG
jgi:hypothetical protein